LLLWCALVLLVAAAVLLVAAICGEDLGEDDERGSDPSDGHKPPPHYTLDDWT
jgi:hypothetical protein